MQQEEKAVFIFKKCSYEELQAIQHREDLLLSGWTLLEKEYMDVTEKVYGEDGTMVALINYYFLNENKSDAAESANASSGSAGAKPGNPEREKPKWEDTITNRMLHWSYTPEQKEEVKKALAAGVPKATILTYFYPEVTVEKKRSYRKKQ